MKESAVSFELLALCYRPPVSRPSFLFSRAATTYASPARKCGVSMPQERSPPQGTALRQLPFSAQPASSPLRAQKQNAPNAPPPSPPESGSHHSRSDGTHTTVLHPQHNSRNKPDH